MGVAADLGIKVSPKDELQDVIYAILDKAAENSAAGIPDQPKRKRTRISKKDTDRVYTVKGEEGENFDVKNGHKASEDKPLPLFSDEVPAAEPAPAAEKPAETKPEPVKEAPAKAAGPSEQELLKELVKLQKKTAKRTGVVAFSMIVIAAVVLASAVLIVPKVLTTLTAAETTLEEATNLMGEVNNSLDGMNKMISNVDTVLTDNTEAMSEAIQKISDIDIDGLNESIKKLNDAVDKLNKAVGNNGRGNNR